MLSVLIVLLGFDGLHLAFPALVLHPLQLLQDPPRLIGRVDQHAQKLEAETRIKYCDNISKPLNIYTDNRKTVCGRRTCICGEVEDVHLQTQLSDIS